MDRRSFVFGSASAALLAGASTLGYRAWREITPTIHRPGMREGHYLRDRQALPAPSAQHDTEIVILGSGIAGLSAAWQLARAGHTRFLLIDGPEAFGNAAGGHFGELAFPTGAHYLPIPSMECTHVREMLFDAGVILREPDANKPYYDERYLLHAPQERVLFNGRWQEGTLPREGVSEDERAEQDRFFAEIAEWQTMRGADGKRLFVLPSVLSSNDAASRALDTLSFKQWLHTLGYRAPSLHWYADYCCRDDYGAGYEQVSAWAGLHYFCSRGGQAANAEDGAWLTWPDGLQPLAAHLAQSAAGRRVTGTAASVTETRNGVELLCFTVTDGKPASFTVRARRAICAMPLFAAARIADLGKYGFDSAQHLPDYAPWLVANFLLEGFPQELPEAPLSWDNVIYGGQGLGYVVATHQDLRVTPPKQTVFTAYVALSGQAPQQARRWLYDAAPNDLVQIAASDLVAAYGERFMRHVKRVDVTLRAHAMAIPRPGFRSNAGAAALRESNGRLLFAHADLSGFSVFEEAAWWGVRAANKLL